MNTESASGEETARQIDLDPTQAPERKRGGDRRAEGGGLFGYNGPERRSGRDRRAGG